MDNVAKPLTPYAQWRMEEDRKFYAIFPEARPVEWQFQSISNTYLESAGNQYSSDVKTYAYPSNATTTTYSSISCVEGAPTSDLSPVPPSHEDTSKSARQAPSTLHYDYNNIPDYMDTPPMPYNHNAGTAAPPSPIQRDCVTRRSSHDLSTSKCEVSTSSISQQLLITFCLHSPFLRLEYLPRPPKYCKTTLWSFHISRNMSFPRTSNDLFFNKL
jgi:hypothetical protein